MQVSDMKFPMEVEWAGMDGDWHDYTFTESATEGRVDARWHPKDTDADNAIAVDTGTFFPDELPKECLARLIAKGGVKVKQ